MSLGVGFKHASWPQSPSLSACRSGCSSQLRLLFRYHACCHAPAMPGCNPILGQPFPWGQLVRIKCVQGNTGQQEEAVSVPTLTYWATSSSAPVHVRLRAASTKPQLNLAQCLARTYSPCPSSTSAPASQLSPLHTSVLLNSS